MSDYDYGAAHDVVFKFPNAEAAFSFLAEQTEEGWRGHVVNERGEEIAEPDFMEVENA